MKYIPILALLASPAGAAPILAIQIEECHEVASSPHQSMVPGQIATNTALACEWPALPENPLTLTLSSFEKGWFEPPAPPATPGAFWSVASALPRAVTGAQGGDAKSVEVVSSDLTHFASSFSHTHTRDCPCGCCEAPWEPKPPVPAVPLPGSGLALLTALTGAL